MGWFVIGLYRYLDGNTIDPDVRVYSLYTILVHGPFWWIVWIGFYVSEFFGSRFERIFRIEKKGK